MKISKITLKVIAFERGLLILYSDCRGVLTNLWLLVNIIVTTSSSSAALVVEVVSTNCTN